jgi:integrase
VRKFALDWVQQYPSISRVNEAIAGARRMGSTETVNSYVIGISDFVNYAGFKDPEEAMQKLTSGEVNAGKRVDGFIDYALKDKPEGLGYAHGTVRNKVFGVKKWLELGGVKVDWARIELPTSTEIREEDRPPTKEELKVLLNAALSLRDRAVIYCATASGLRMGTLLSLKVGEVEFSYPDVARFTVERKPGRKFSNRGGNQAKFFCSFITPEAKVVLQQYLKERQAYGEKVTAESPLFSDTYHKGHVINLDDFQKVWYRLLRRAGLAKKSNNWFMLRLHTLRKYMRSHCIGVDASYRERWMGHKGAYLDMSYFKVEEEQHLNEYRKAVPHLTIHTTVTDEKNLRKKMLLDFAKIQGSPEDELKRLDEILARSKDIDEGIKEFRRFKEEETREPSPRKTAHDGNGKYYIAHGEAEMIQRLHDGWELKHALSYDKYLVERL